MGYDRNNSFEELTLAAALLLEVPVYKAQIRISLITINFHYMVCILCYHSKIINIKYPNGKVMKANTTSWDHCSNIIVSNLVRILFFPALVCRRVVITCALCYPYPHDPPVWHPCFDQPADPDMVTNPILFQTSSVSIELLHDLACLHAANQKTCSSNSLLIYCKQGSQSQVLKDV